VKEDKVVAKTISKLYSGKAKKEDFRILLDYLLKNSSIGENLSSRLPRIVFENTESEHGGVEYGKNYWSMFESYVILNEKIIENACNGDRDSIFDMIETCGHEVTHYYQHIRGDFDKHEGFGKLSADEVSQILEIVGYYRDGLGSNLIEKDIAYGSYVGLPHEKEARESSVNFLKEVEQHLSENKYVNQKTKNKLKQDIEDKIKTAEVIESYIKGYYVKYNEFLEYLKKIDIHRLMNHKVSTLNENIAKNLIKTVILSKDSKEIVDAYTGLIGTGEQYKLLREGLTIAINSNFVTDEVRDKFINDIVSVLKEEDMGEEFYEKELKDILNSEQILQIYETLLKENPKKLSGTLFDNVMFDRKDRLTMGKLKLVLENCDYIMENFSKYDNEDLIEIRRQLNCLPPILNTNLEDQYKEKITKLKDFLYKIEENKEKVKSATSR